MTGVNQRAGKMPTPQAENLLFVEQAGQPVLGNAAISEFRLLVELAADLILHLYQVRECRRSRRGVGC